MVGRAWYMPPSMMRTACPEVARGPKVAAFNRRARLISHGSSGDLIATRADGNQIRYFVVM